MEPHQQNDINRRATDEAYARQERRDLFFRCGGYDCAPGAPIIAPSPITAQVQRLSAETMRECDEIMARANRRNIAATVELEMITEGHVRETRAELHE